MTTSATGGYLTPSTTSGFPGGLTLEQFIQTVLVGLTALPGNLVRPSWQVKPPKRPDNTVNWIAYGITNDTPDANAYVGLDAASNFNMQRHEGLEIECSFYGPNAYDILTELRDGFQIHQNIEALNSANMGFTSTSSAPHAPELVNEVWFNRYQMSIFLRRQIQRTYAVLTLISANGTITAADTITGGGEISVDWDASP